MRPTTIDIRDEEEATVCGRRGEYLDLVYDYLSGFWEVITVD
jgi:hypothetical protein